MVPFTNENGERVYVTLILDKDLDMDLLDRAEEKTPNEWIRLFYALKAKQAAETLDRLEAEGKLPSFVQNKPNRFAAFPSGIIEPSAYTPDVESRSNHYYIGG